MILVTRSSRTVTATINQNGLRSAPLAILFLFLAANAQPRVRQRVESLEGDLGAALMTLAEVLGRVVQTAQRLVEVPPVAALLAGHQELLLTLHRVGSLVGHVIRIGRQVAIGGLQRGVERLAVVAEFLHHTGALIEQAGFQVLELFLRHDQSTSSGPGRSRRSSERRTSSAAT